MAMKFKDPEVKESAAMQKAVRGITTGFSIAIGSTFGYVSYLGFNATEKLLRISPNLAAVYGSTRISPVETITMTVATGSYAMFWGVVAAKNAGLIDLAKSIKR